MMEVLQQQRKGEISSRMQDNISSECARVRCQERGSEEGKKEAARGRKKRRGREQRREVEKRREKEEKGRWRDFSRAHKKIIFCALERGERKRGEREKRREKRERDRILSPFNGCDRATCCDHLNHFK